VVVSGAPQAPKHCWMLPPPARQLVQQTQLMLPAQALTWEQHFIFAQEVQAVSPAMGAHRPPLEELLDELVVPPPHSLAQLVAAQLTNACVTVSYMPQAAQAPGLLGFCERQPVQHTQDWSFWQGTSSAQQAALVHFTQASSCGSRVHPPPPEELDVVAPELEDELAAPEDELALPDEDEVVTDPLDVEPLLLDVELPPPPPCPAPPVPNSTPVLPQPPPSDAAPRTPAPTSM